MEKGDGMSFAEFTYPLLQAWDFWHLYNSPLEINLQIGGTDQFGNIVAGIDAIKSISKRHPNPDVRAKYEGEKALPPAFGLTVPLLTTAGGEKFGKSAGNAIWLDKGMTSTFDLYQVPSPTFVRSYMAMLTQGVVLYASNGRGGW